MDGKVRTVEQMLDRLARRSHGVVTRREMLRAGISAMEIDGRAKRGLLIRQYRGVYRVGHAAPSVDASFMAAVKTCGREAELGGRAGAYLLGLVKGRVPQPEVYAPTERRVKGIKTHRAARASTKVRGIPVTTVPETLVDLAAVMTPDDLARACHEAGVKYRVGPKQVEVVLSKRPHAPGAGRLRAVMNGDVRVLLSEMERLFVGAVREARLPLPVTNKAASGRRVDCRWPGLTVELDSYTFHNSRHAWEQDRQREREARARQDEFRRYTWYDVTDGRAAMIADLSRLVPVPHASPMPNEMTVR
jgi:Transcriptional regulator, AbiEi antitoxin